jgi:hypothetical protein
MGAAAGPNIVRSGITLALDSANQRSYISGSSSWTDLSGNSNNGTLTNGPSFSGINCSCIVFDGTNDYVSVSYNSVLNTPNGATYNIWIYPTQTGEFLNRGTSDSGATPDNPRLYIDVSNKNVYFDWSSVSVDRYVTTTNNSFNSNSWIQITATVTVGGRMEVYINGTVCTYTIRSNADTMPNPLPNTNDPIQIGGATWIPRYFGGRISIVSLYNRSLSATEVLNNYNETKSRFGL